MISKSTIDKIFEAAVIEEVVGDYVNLKKRGVNYVGLCPFHNEKTPSFSVSPSKGIYKCFGCGEAGNAVNFVMKHEHFTYPEALKNLAEKYGIPIEETESSPEQKEAQSLRESYQIINDFANEYFKDILHNNEEGKSVGLSYFRERGYTNETINKFELGYCLNTQDTFTQTAIKKGYKIDFLKALGLTTSNGNDFYRERVIFPIHSVAGKVIGFGARVLKQGEKTAKYFNSPESEIYHKSKVLYGLFQAKTAIRKEDNCFLVEGYTDVIALSQAGIENVVSSSGTSLTVEQIRLIKRHTPNITLLYDGDQAGIKAAMRGMGLILEEDLNVKVVQFPEGEDPDSYLKLKGAEDFKIYLQEQTKDFVLFATQNLLKEAENDPIKRTNAVKESATILSKISEPIKRSLYIKECAKLLDIKEQLLINEVNKLKRKDLQKTLNTSQEEAEVLDASYDITKAEPQQEKQETSVYQEKTIVKILLEFANKPLSETSTVGQYIIEEVKQAEFDDALSKKIISLCDEYQKQNGTFPESRFFITHKDEAISSFVVDLISDAYELSENWDKKHDIFITDKSMNYKNDVESALGNFKLKKIQKLIIENEQKLKAAKNDTELETTMKIHAKLLSMKQQICKESGTVIT